MSDGFKILLIPLLVFLVAGSVAIAAYYFTRDFWRKTLDSSRGARFLYIAIAVIILPLILGGWSDIVDASELLQGNVKLEDSIPLSLLAILLVVYLYIHGCWFDREEYSLLTRTNEIGRIEELDCQKNYLVRLLENFRACIGRYGERLRVALAEVKNEPTQVSERIRKDLLRDNLRMIVEAVRQTYKSVETVPKDYGLKVLLLEARNGFLEHVESYDGTSWDCWKEVCDSHRTQYFSLSSPNSSAAVASVVSGTIQIIESCEECHRDDGHPFWYFQDCIPLQKEELGSMLVVPFDIEVSRKFALCLSCSQPRAFLKRHVWKAKAVQENLQARFALLYSQTEAFDALCAESSGLRNEKASLAIEISSLRHQVSSLQEENSKKDTSLARAEETRLELTADLEKLKEQLVQSTKKSMIRKNRGNEGMETKQ